MLAALCSHQTNSTETTWSLFPVGLTLAVPVETILQTTALYIQEGTIAASHVSA